MLRHWDNLPKIQRDGISKAMMDGAEVKHFGPIINPRTGAVDRPGCPALGPASKPFWDLYSYLQRTPSFGGYGPIPLSEKLCLLDEHGLQDPSVRDAYLTAWHALDAELYLFAVEQEEERKGARGGK